MRESSQKYRYTILTSVSSVLLLLCGIIIPDRCRASGYEFEGVGARQISRAGAAIADSGDWTAIYWNPANLADASAGGKREAGLELFGGKMYAKDSNSLSNPKVAPYTAFTNDKISSPFLLGAAGAVIPAGEKLGIGFGFYTPLLQGVDFSDSAPGSDIRYKSSAGIMVWNVSAGYRLTAKLSAGAGVNLVYGRLTTESVYSFSAPPYPDRIEGNVSGHGYGLEAIIGARYDFTPQVSLGAVFRSGSRVPVKGDADVKSRVFGAETSRFSFRLNNPPTSGIGLALRTDKDLTLTFDFTQTYWSGFRNGTFYERQGLLITDSANTFHWRDTYKLKFGMLKKLNEKTELLAGYSFDRSALDPGSVDFSTVVDVSVHRFSAGFARKWGRGFETALGAMTGTGRREDNGVSYRLTGLQIMAETRLGF